MFAFCIDWLKTGVVISEKFGNSEFGPRGDNSEFQLETTKKLVPTVSVLKFENHWNPH